MIIFILLATILIYLPIFINPDLLLARSNDLQNQFWPVFYYMRENFLKFHQIPFWNSLIYAGIPTLPDPQFTPFYPPNFLFLLLPTNSAILLFFIIHTLLAIFTSYILAKHGLKLSKEASLFFTALYITTPKLAGYMEAGHYGLFASHAWIPLAIYSIIKLSQQIKIKYSVLLGISLSALYFTHTVIFIISVPTTFALFIYLFFNKPSKYLRKSLLFILSFLIFFGLSAITLLPQINWVPNTTRTLLSFHPDVYPKWNSVSEFFANLTPNTSQIKTIEVEKWLTLGILPLLLATIGFLYQPIKRKIVILIILAGSLVFMINNLSPFYPTLLFENWYSLMRVTTRIWFIPATLLLILASIAFEKLYALNKKILFILAFVTILECLDISEARVTQKPIITTPHVQSDLISYLKKDNDLYRVFCTTRCLSEQDAAVNQIELLDGYNTLQQINFYYQSQKAMGGSWTYYTLPIPPIEIGALTPNAQLLGQYNVKYIISPYKLDTSGLIYINSFSNNFYLYENIYNLPRSNEKITLYTPNFIRVATQSQTEIILRNTYNPDWEAVTNQGVKKKIEENNYSTNSVKVNSDTQFIDFIYSPPSFKVGLVITIVTITMLLIILKI